MAEKVYYRMMTLSDVDAVLGVEQAVFNHPWTRDAFDNELQNNRFALYLVAELGTKIIGYCGMWVVFEDSHITNIAILPEYRGLKVGETLMRKAMILARMKQATSMSLEVRVSNHIAQGLYQKLGFQNGGIRKRYYTDNHEDAQVMWVTL